jgi:hypothetical protein
MEHAEFMDMREVPPIIYQLLLLSRMGQKRVVLKRIMDYFYKLDKMIEEGTNGTTE